MFPLSLRLSGFRGIRDGLGLDVLTLDLERLAGDAQLVALAGANGRGKSTVLDNLHPFLTLPSRAAQAGPGGFSFYDHVVLPENEKDLVWSHDGRRFRSQVVIRCNGRRTTDAFLFEADPQGCWKPVRLPDGTVSDGKTSTYNRCVEHLLGSPETFFTSVFSAQCKRQLSAYPNSEIKRLLADLLGQERLREEGQKAAQVVDQLKVGLVAMRQQRGSQDELLERLRGEHGRLNCASAQVDILAQAKVDAQRAQDSARAHLAQLQAASEQAQGGDAQRAQLDGERVALIRTGREVIEGIKAQIAGQQQRLERLTQRVDLRKAQWATRSQTLAASRRQCEGVLEDEVAVRHAQRRLEAAKAVAGLRAERSLQVRLRVQELHLCTSALESSQQRLAAIEREAGQAALRAEDLARRFGLTREVPCAEMDLQGRCQLLGDARDAEVLMPSAQGTIRKLAKDKKEVQAQIDDQQEQCKRLAGAPQVLMLAERRAVASGDRAIRYGRLAARMGEMSQALDRLADIDRELAGLAGQGVQQDETEDERVERLDIEATVQVLDAQQGQQAQHYRAGLNRLLDALAALPAPFDAQVLADARRQLDAAQFAVAQAEHVYLRAVRDDEAKLALEGQIVERQRDQDALGDRIAGVAEQLGNWNLLVKCLGSDGLIALAIDDAGPALSGLANDLLLASCGPRFTVSLLTQVETRRGDQREGFAIQVHDGDTGVSKPVEQMSGGERVWINECLVRAVALYLAQNDGRCYGTLFCDEADGALDPQRKRSFIAMKREVLRLGGYAREFFVSQTPELTAMADAVIDLDAMVCCRPDIAHA
ncbi:DNA repair protein [Roseateles flavus]|uniref:DNA repair protein n=1 Tax=Roseateles flavus TaxID=3149041 RepID=A0ABV0GG99_9BURK